MEEWRAIVGFDGYFVSDSGRVLSRVRGPGRILRHCLFDGYPIISMKGPNGQRTKRIHHLVLDAFRGPRPYGCEASHLNGDPSDNRLSNLIWETHKANNNRRETHGTVLRGDMHCCSKLTERGVAEARDLHSNGHTISELASVFGVSSSTMSMAVSGKHWSHVCNTEQPKTREACK